MANAPRLATGRAIALLLIPVLVVALAACTSPSESELAHDALQRGLDAHAAGRLDEAARDYYETLMHDMANKYAFYNLGVIEQTKERPAGAEAFYRLALQIDPAYPPALYNLAIIREDAGDLQGAIDLYRRAIAAEPTNAAAHLRLGLLLIKTGNQPAGSAEIAAALQIDPTLVVPSVAPLATPTPTPTRVPTPNATALPTGSPSPTP
jgi:tetratricopeptide (TPR) repeat protein